MEKRNPKIERTLQSTHSNGQRNGRIRRRGDSLESDILEAAWAELSDVGYARLTMEGVAARAQTSKTVVYRRWSNRAELILAAIRHRGPLLSGEVPNTGNLRSDVLALLHRVYSQRMQEMGMETIHGLIAELIASNAEPVFFHSRQDGYDTMSRILKHAADRGELNLAEISPRIVCLPVDLVRHEILTTDEPLSEATIIEIVDDIFLPLIRLHQPK